jgi:hypothetical protein
MVWETGTSQRGSKDDNNARPLFQAGLIES